MPKPKAVRMAPGVGFEPTTNRLTADRSTTELPRNSTASGERYLSTPPQQTQLFFNVTAPFRPPLPPGFAKKTLFTESSHSFGVPRSTPPADAASIGEARTAGRLERRKTHRLQAATAPEQGLKGSLSVTGIPAKATRGRSAGSAGGHCPPRGRNSGNTRTGNDKPWLLRCGPSGCWPPPSRASRHASRWD